MLGPQDWLPEALQVGGIDPCIVLFGIRGSLFAIKVKVATLKRDLSHSLFTIQVSSWGKIRFSQINSK